jgi:hypothetical protein
MSWLRTYLRDTAFYGTKCARMLAVWSLLLCRAHTCITQVTNVHINHACTAYLMVLMVAFPHTLAGSSTHSPLHHINPFEETGQLPAPAA